MLIVLSFLSSVHSAAPHSNEKPGSVYKTQHAAPWSHSFIAMWVEDPVHTVLFPLSGAGKGV